MFGKIDFLGLSLKTGNLDELADWLISIVRLDSHPSVIVNHINANNYYLLSQRPELYQKLKNNSYLLLDGIAMKLAVYWLFHRWIPDLNGTDIFPLFMKHLSEEAIPVYFLGSDKLTIEKAVKRIQNQWHKVNIVGYHSGYFTAADETKIVRAINNSQAKVLLVGRGFPLQEEFTLRVRNRLKVALIWNVGGLFDFISENKQRAPLWMRRWRLEWLFRLALEPKRLWSRTFVVGPWLAGRIFLAQFERSKRMWTGDIV